MVPKGRPSGSYPVEFFGEYGQMGESTYTGRGEIKVSTVGVKTTANVQTMISTTMTKTVEKGKTVYIGEPTVNASPRSPAPITRVIKSISDSVKSVIANRVNARPPVRRVAVTPSGNSVYSDIRSTSYTIGETVAGNNSTTDRTTVINAYKNVLGRKPDYRGFIYWMRRLKTATPVQLEAEFMSAANRELASRKLRCRLAAGRDPLAQTFTLSESRYITKFAVWFTAVGDENLFCMIVKTENGVPTQDTLIEQVIPRSSVVVNPDMATDGLPTMIKFDYPVYLKANEEYAIIVGTDEPDSKVMVSKLGGFDPRIGKGWVTSQSFLTGVLLGSSNLKTWTPYQDTDMKMEVYGAKFKSTQTTLTLGSISVPPSTDLLANFQAGRNSAETDVRVQLKFTNGQIIDLQEQSPRSFPRVIQGNATVQAVLYGTEHDSPFLMSDVSLMFTKVRESAEYITRAIPVLNEDGNPATVTITLDEYEPMGSSIEVSVQQDSVFGDPLTPVRDNTFEDGFELADRRYQVENVTDPFIRVKIRLTGKPDAVPFVKNLRVTIT